MRTQKSRTKPKQKKDRNPYNVAIGQVWRSLDPRRNVEGRVETVDLKNGLARLKYVGSNRSGSVPLDRFLGKTSRGFRLVQEVGDIHEDVAPTATVAPTDDAIEAHFENEAGTNAANLADESDASDANA